MHLIEIGNDEPLSGYLSRLAALRGVRLWDFRLHGGILTRYDSKPRYYKHVSAVTGLDTALLKRHDFVKVGGTFNTFDMTFDVNDIWAKSARACPCCIREDIAQGTGRVEARPRLRFGWMLRTLGRCAVHGVPLVEIGPGYDRFSMGDFSGTLARYRGVWAAVGGTEDEFRTSADRDVDTNGASTRRASDAYFQNRIAATAAKRANGARSGDHALPLSPSAVEALQDDDLRMLDDMPVPAGLLLTEVVGGMELFGERYRRSEASDEDRQAAVAGGYEVTRRGYAGLTQFLSALDQVHWRVQRRGRFKKLYGTLQEMLSSRVGLEGYEKVTRFIVEHAYTHHALGPEDTFLGLGLPRRLHSIRTAEVAHGIHRITLRRILDAAGLLPSGAGGLGDGRVLVDAGALERLIADWRDRLPFEEAKARLGVSAAALETMVSRGLLLRDEDPGRRGNISRNSFEELTRLLERLPLGVPGPGMRRLTEMVKMGRRTYGEVVGLIIDGTIKSVIRDARHNGTFRFDSIFVDPAEVKGASPISAPPGITIQLAERELGTTRTTVEQLVASGILKSVSAENPATGKRQTFVVPSGLEDFRATYISLFDYSKGRDQIGNVKKKLTAAGIMPAFEKAGAATFYRRDALPAAWD